jgi:hypothetical protein
VPTITAGVPFACTLPLTATAIRFQPFHTGKGRRLSPIDQCRESPPDISHAVQCFDFFRVESLPNTRIFKAGVSMRVAAAIACTLVLLMTPIHAQAVRQQSSTTSFDNVALDAALRQLQARQFQAGQEQARQAQAQAMPFEATSPAASGSGKHCCAFGQRGAGARSIDERRPRHAGGDPRRVRQPLRNAPSRCGPICGA